MSMQTPAPDQARAQQHTNNDGLILKGASGGRNPDGTFAAGNRNSWKHGAYSTQTRRALVEDPAAATALAEHCQEIETDLGGNASRLERDLVRRYVETAALADHLGRHLTHGGALTATRAGRKTLASRSFRPGPEWHWPVATPSTVLVEGLVNLGLIEQRSRWVSVWLADGQGRRAAGAISSRSRVRARLASGTLRLIA